ncbi:unnamed protein product [Amoebophrya sp. A120]|nr:unnamed protein product [Amoebophrya sp. A120]|eukprot:GSA120T00013709001.1
MTTAVTREQQVAKGLDNKRDLDNNNEDSVDGSQDQDNNQEDRSPIVYEYDDFSFDEETGLGQPKIIKPYRSWKDALLYVFTPARIVLLVLLVIAIPALPKFDDLPTRHIPYFPKRVLADYKKKSWTHIEKVKFAHNGLSPNPDKDVTFEWTEYDEASQQEVTIKCVPNVNNRAGISVDEEQGKINDKFMSIRQFVVLTMIVWMVVFMVEGIPPELAIFTVILFSYFFSMISYEIPLSDYCSNAKPSQTLTVEPLLLLEQVSQIYTGLSSKNTLLYAGMFVLSAAFTETKILEKLLGSIIGSPTSHFGIIGRLMVPAMVLSSVCPNGPVTQMCMPLVVAVTDKTGLYTPRVYYLALAFMVTLGGNLTLIGSTPCIYALNAFKLKKDGRETLQTQQCRETLMAAHNWRKLDDADGNPVNYKIRDVWNDRERVPEPGFEFIGESAHYEELVAKQCSFSTIDGGFLILALLVAVACIPTVRFCIHVFAKDEDIAKEKQRQLELEDGSAASSEGEHDAALSSKDLVEHKIAEDRAYGAEDEERRTSVQLGLDDLKARETAVAFKFTEGNEVVEDEVFGEGENNNTAINKEQQPLLDLESGERAAPDTSMRNRSKSVKIVPEHLTRRGTTTGEAISKYQNGNVSVIPTKPVLDTRHAVYDVEFKVTKDCKALLGTTLEESALYRMKDVEIYLHVAAGTKKPAFATRAEELPEMGALSVYYEEDGTTAAPVAPAASSTPAKPASSSSSKARNNDDNSPLLMKDPSEIFLQPNCVLGIRAQASTIGKLQRQFLGLTPNADYYELLGRSRKTRQMYEMVLSEKYLKKLSTKKFFLEHDAVILGVDEVNGFVLVEGFQVFGQLAQKGGRFPEVKMVSAVIGSSPPRAVSTFDTIRGFVAFIGFLIVIGITAIPELKIGNFKLDDQFATLIIGLGVLLVALRCITWKQAIGSMNAGVLLLFAFADALQVIMANSKTSEFLAQMIDKVTAGNKALIVFFTGIVVSVLTQFLNNATCTQMLWDSTLNLCYRSGIPFKPMICLLAQTSGFAFCTPIGMPPTLLVKVPGNYEFGDYLRAGWLTQVVATFLTCLLVSVWVAYDTGDVEENVKFLFSW